MLPCPVLSPELIPENSQALISQHRHKIPGRNSIPLQGTAQTSPNSQSLGCRGLAKGSDSSTESQAGNPTLPHCGKAARYYFKSSGHAPAGIHPPLPCPELLLLPHVLNFILLEPRIPSGLLGHLGRVAQGHGRDSRSSSLSTGFCREFCNSPSSARGTATAGEGSAGTRPIQARIKAGFNAWHLQQSLREAPEPHARDGYNKRRP